MIKIFDESENAKKRWVYLDTSENYNDTYSLGELNGYFCYTGEALINYIEQEISASNYPKGHIIRVHHSVTGPPGAGSLDCGYQYYQVISGEWKEFDHLLPYTVNHKKDEDLDNATISMYTKENVVYPPLTKVELIESNNVSSWIISNCQNERVSINLWRQTIDLIEPVELLKGYPLDNITITQPINPDTKHKIKSIADVVNHLIDIAITHCEGKTSLRDKLRLTADEETRLSKIESPEFAFTEMTLFDALIEIGIFLDSMPKISFTSMGKLLLYFEPFEIDFKQNYTISNLQTEIKQHPLSNYADAVVSTVSNLHTESPVIYPGNELFVYVDSGTNIEITKENARITLPYRIKKIVKFEVYHLGMTADFTHYVYEDGFWNLLYPVKHGDDSKEIPDYERKPNTVHYKYNSNVIEFGEYWVMMPAIREARFRITYIPIYDTKVIQTSVDNPEFTVINNQNENLVEGNAFATKLRNYLKRMKHGDYYISRKYRQLSDIPQVGHLVNNKYVITNISYTKYVNHFDVVLYLSEGYTRRADFIRAKQEIRSWEIPADGKVVNRLINYREKVKFSLGYPTSKYSETAPSVKDLTSVFQNLVGGSLTPDTLAAIDFYTKNSTIPTMMTTVVGSIGNSLTFNFKAIDNTLLGFSKALNWKDSVTMQQGVTYTDEYGNVENATIGFTSDWFDDIVDSEFVARNYPMSTITQNTKLFNASFIKIDNLILKKDAREILNFTYQLETEGLNNTVVHHDLINYALGQRVDTEWEVMMISPFIFFLNRKIFNENEVITKDDVISYTYVNWAEGDKTVVYSLPSSNTPPENYEAIAIGFEIEIPPIPFEDFENKYKICLIQNEITTKLREQIKDTGKITLYYST